ncbi:MAG: branched-chain amino acid transport system ATP-binding protein [Solirubrobacterales bacterium]|jgi:branched-chain amino acid transport system ATP-binding protein|nr:branched-chain amino acid transport system ATP-binding protein [Solirubrobacterales bacterium]
MADLLEVLDLQAGYGGNAVLQGVTMNVAESETVLLLGPNGHGKSTLALAISGGLEPTGGEVRFLGERIDGLSRAETLRAGLVHIPQGDALFPEMTVLQNLVVASGFSREAWGQRKTALAEVFEFFPRLAERSSQAAASLSGGERRMLALGRGLMMPSRLLVIDEPALGLAPIVADEVYSRIREIAKEGRSVLLIDESATHAEIAERVYVMQSGEIVSHVPSDKFFDHPDLVNNYFTGLSA